MSRLLLDRVVDRMVKHEDGVVTVTGPLDSREATTTTIQFQGDEADVARMKKILASVIRAVVAPRGEDLDVPSASRKLLWDRVFSDGSLQVD